MAYHTVFDIAQTLFDCRFCRVGSTLVCDASNKLNTTSRFKVQTLGPEWQRPMKKAVVKPIGCANAQSWLGAAYEQGWFGNPNFTEALKWFRNSANKATPTRKTLGQMYEDGEGVIQDYSSAAQWYTTAAQHIRRFGGAGQRRNIWDCSIWMVGEFQQITFRLTCGLSFLVLNQTCPLSKLT